MKKRKFQKKVWAIKAAILFAAVVFSVQPCMAAIDLSKNDPEVTGALPEAVWQYQDGSWYFYQEWQGMEKSYSSNGWRWIDGYCYYFYEDGKMASAVITPDGYQVSGQGAWIENGVAVQILGKGILTKPIDVGRNDKIRSPRGTSGGSGNGGSGGSSNDREDDRTNETEQNETGKKRLLHWEQIAREADYIITGIDNPSYIGYLVTNKTENDIRIKHLISIISEADVSVFYMIGVDYQPDTLMIGQSFPDNLVYSNTIVELFYIHGVTYTISRIGIQKIQNNVEEIPETENDLEETVPPDGNYYAYGDTLTRKIGNKQYRFRCIDEDYEDSSGNRQGMALFLCDTIIRADTDSSETERTLLQFGKNNNYKDSKVRRWLLEHTRDSQFSQMPVGIGVDQAYGGDTELGSFEQMNEGELIPYPISWQQMNDSIFLLSVEEAMIYADELWRFGGKEENNPESVYSPYSKGYYLRTPLYEEEDGDFYYGSGIYGVDLLGGNLRVMDVSYTTMGLRPAFVLSNK